jgi:hypothetical protein
MVVFRRRQFFAEKGMCHMQENTITQLPDPSGFSAGAFPDVIREDAQKLIGQAIHSELATPNWPLRTGHADGWLFQGKA